VAGKRIRNDETPPKAGFRVLGRWARNRTAQNVAQKRMEVDAAFPGSWFLAVENIRRLNHHGE